MSEPTVLTPARVTSLQVPVLVCPFPKLVYVACSSRPVGFVCSSRYPEVPIWLCPFGARAFSDAWPFLNRIIHGHHVRQCEFRALAEQMRDENALGTCHRTAFRIIETDTVLTALAVLDALPEGTG